MKPDESGPKLSFRERLAARRAESANDPRWNRPGWVAVQKRMQALFSATPTPGLSPDAITRAASEAGIAFDFVLLLNPWRTSPEGKGAVVFEELTAEALFDSVFEEHPPTPGPVWFVPHDLLFHLDEPYYVTGETLRSFVTERRHLLPEDVLFIWQEAPRLSLIHHEGGYTHIFFPNPVANDGTETEARE